MVQTRLVVPRECEEMFAEEWRSETWTLPGWEGLEIHWGTWDEMRGLKSLRLVSKLKWKIYTKQLQDLDRTETNTGHENWSRFNIHFRNKHFPCHEWRRWRWSCRLFFFYFYFLYLSRPLSFFKNVSKKSIYSTTVKVSHRKSLKRQKAGQNCYKLQVWHRWRTHINPKAYCWRIIHRAIATDRHLAHLNPAVVGECRFCGEQEVQQITRPFCFA